MVILRNVVTVLFLLSLVPFLVALWMKASAVEAGRALIIAPGLVGKLQRGADELPVMVAALWLGGMSSAMWIDAWLRARTRQWRRVVPFQNKFPNVALADAAAHVREHLARHRGAAAPPLTADAVGHAIVDCAVNGVLAMWGRDGDKALELIYPPVVADGALDIARGALDTVGPRGRRRRFTDIRLDWADVTRVWPPTASWSRPTLPLPAHVAASATAE